MAEKDAAKKPSKVRSVVSDASKTPEELAAEIAAAAESLGTAKTTKDVIAENPVAADEKTTKKVSAKPSPKTTEDEGIKITVKRGLPAAPAASDTSIDASATETAAVQSPRIMGHTGRTIVPLGKSVSDEPDQPEASTDELETAASEVSLDETDDQPEPSADTVAAPTTPESPQEEVDSSAEEPVVVAAEPSQAAESAEQETVDANAEEQEQQAAGEAGHKLDAIAGELRAREAAKAAKSEELQTAKIYDTTKYHVPIKVNRHHRKAAVPLWIEIVILVVGLVGALLYASWSGMIDVDVPFLTKKVEPQTSLQPAAQSKHESPDAVEQTAKPTTLLSLFEAVDAKSGTAELTFSDLAGNSYSFTGPFVASEDGAIVADFVGDDGRDQADTLLQDELKSLRYSQTGLTKNSATYEALPNTQAWAELSAANLLGLNQVFGGEWRDESLRFSAPDQTLSQACQVAVDAFMKSYDEMSFTKGQSDASSASQPVYTKYASLTKDCPTDGADQNLTPESLTIKTTQTPEQLTIEILKGKTVQTTLKLTKLSPNQSASVPTETLFAPSSQRYIDLVLLARCSASAFDGFKTEDKIIARALDDACSVIKR